MTKSKLLHLYLNSNKDPDSFFLVYKCIVDDRSKSYRFSDYTGYQYILSIQEHFISVHEGSFDNYIKVSNDNLCYYRSMMGELL